MPAIDFPSNPVNGQTFTVGAVTWTFSSTKGVWNITNNGIRGFQGFQGVPGIDGAYAGIGYQGYQGFQGAVGAQGAQGAQGFQGVQGAQGVNAGPAYDQANAAYAKANTKASIGLVIALS